MGENTWRVGVETMIPDSALRSPWTAQKYPPWVNTPRDRLIYNAGAEDGRDMAHMSVDELAVIAKKKMEEANV